MIAIDEPRELLTRLFEAAWQAVDPLHCLANHLPPRPRGRTLVVGAGKASARMARAVEAVWDGPLSGLVVTRYGHGERCERIEIVEAGHPIPDAAGTDAARRMLSLAADAGPDDLVLALISGGGSSLLTLPPAGVSLDELRSLNQTLLLSGANISEMNLVRRHVSAIKNGRLARSCGKASLCTLVVSDVPGDTAATVASGPTIDDGSSPGDALAVLHRYCVEVPLSIRRLLESGQPSESGLQGQRVVSVIATADQALHAATQSATRLGLSVLNLGGEIEGESREVAQMHAGLARYLQRQQPTGMPRLLLSGGETTVTVRGRGRGGRNSEFLLALSLALDGRAGIHALACDTDGIDGVEDNAGGTIGPDSLRRARALGLDPRALLSNNDAYRYLHTLGDLIVTGPTRTNVNDFRAVLIQ